MRFLLGVIFHKSLNIKQTSINMSSANDVKVAMTYFPIQPDNIRRNKVGTELAPLRIIKYQNYLQQCAINILTNEEALHLLGTVISNADYESFNNNQIWVAPKDPAIAPVLPTASAKVV